MDTINDIISDLKKGKQKSIARAISVVENRENGFLTILESLKPNLEIPVIGITGAPGAGKSSIVNALVKYWLELGQKIAVVAVDPSSPFNFGALLGDRIRMSDVFMHPNVFIRSVASRGSLGGLSASIIEITDIFRNSGFDKIVVETVGVGQSEVEIAGIADVTVVVTVPESGDEVQTLKSGVMEIADIFVVNKSDRKGAEIFARHLRDLSLQRSHEKKIPVVETVATENKGIAELAEAISIYNQNTNQNKRKYLILAEKLEQLVIKERMRDFDLSAVAELLEKEMNKPEFNLYVFSRQFTKT